VKRVASVAGTFVLFYLGIGLTWSLLAALGGLTLEQEQAWRHLSPFRCDRGGVGRARKTKPQQLKRGSDHAP
jgi:hypothetical protein